MFFEKLNKIIIEEIEKVIYIKKNKLNEYHHSFDNGLYQDAINIGEKILDLRSKNWNSMNSFTYKLSSLTLDKNEPFNISVSLVDGNVSQFHAWRQIKISKTLVDDILNQGKSKDKLFAAIFHELGHLITLNKANSLSVLSPDFKNPLMLKMSDENYKNLTKILYRFRKNEMDARCFETSMFLKQNIDNNISLKELYDNRCSDITMMQNFVNYLFKLSNNIVNNDDKYTIDGLYKTIFKKPFFQKNNLSHEIMAKKLYFFFNKKLINFKKKIDKIYYDYKQIS